MENEQDISISDDYLIYIGNATLFLQLDGVKFLVDPSFLHENKKKHLGWGLISKRVHPPAKIYTDLPKADYILLTHTHLDHFDMKPNEVGKIPIITNRSAMKELSDKFYDVRALNNDIEISDIKISKVPAQHGPKFMRPFVGEVIGFAITTSKHKIWISGDTITHNKLSNYLNEYNPDIGVVNFGAAKAYFIRLTYDADDAINTIGKFDNLTTIAVHIDDWSHFTSNKTDIKEKFMRNNLKLIIPERGAKLALNDL